MLKCNYLSQHIKTENADLTSEEDKIYEVFNQELIRNVLEA